LRFEADSGRGPSCSEMVNKDKDSQEMAEVAQEFEATLHHVDPMYAIKIGKDSVSL